MAVHREVVDWPPLWALDESTLDQAFLYEPFYRPFVYSEVRYLGPGKKIKAKRRRTEGPGRASTSPPRDPHYDPCR